MTQHQYKVGDKVKRLENGDLCTASLIEYRGVQTWLVQCEYHGKQEQWLEEFFEPLDSPISLQPGDRVRHETLGEGNLVGDPNKVAGTVAVQFDQVSSYHSIALNLLTKVEPKQEGQPDWGEIDRKKSLAFVPPVLESAHIDPVALDAATEGAGMLDSLAFTTYGRNFLAHALVRLKKCDWLKESEEDPQIQKTLRELAADIPNLGLHGKLYAGFGRDSQAAQLAVDVLRQHFDSLRPEIAKRWDADQIEALLFGDDS